MKKIELFKRRLIFKIEKQEAEEVEYTRNPGEILSEKIIYLIVMMAVIGLSSKLYLLAPQLNEGDVVTKDIVAPRSLRYNDRVAKDRIVEDILKISPREYIYISEVEGKTLKEIVNIYSEVREIKAHVEQDIEKLKMEDKEVDKNTRVVMVDEKLVKIDSPLSLSTLRGLYELSDKEISLSEKRVRDRAIELYKIGVVKGQKLRDGSGGIDELKGEYDITPLDSVILDRVVVANYVFDEASTRVLLEEKVGQVEDVITYIEAGSILAKKGEILTDRQVRVLRAYGIHSFQTNLTKVISHILYIVMISVVFYLLIIKYLRKEILNRSSYTSIMLIVAVTFLAFRFTGESFIYLIPIDAMFFLFGILVNSTFAAIVGAMVLAFLLPLVGFDLVFYLVTSITFMLGMYQLDSLKNRTSLINAGLKIGIAKMVVLVFVSTILREEALRILLNGGAAILSGIFSGMLTIALLPYFERTFNILTTFKLIELGDLSNPLLKKLSVNTPGTFHHSMMVATLSENAAEVIGANAIFCRVASYYHDIGKIKRPNFYVENQRQMRNPHNDLAPSMSNLIITSHTKDGVEMGKENGIPREIRDVMLEHQGTTLLAYFYNKAKQLDPTVNESDFRYSGPKPRTKESAIIMLADSIEAAVRSLDEKTPITMEKMIRKIISGKIEDNQLSEADLTFKEIDAIIASFVKTLMGIHHIRLKYPGQKN